MAEIVQHNLLERDTHLAVLADGQPRQARYLTTYDDGTTTETIHMLYKEGDTVRSCPINEWRPDMADLPGPAPH